MMKLAICAIIGAAALASPAAAHDTETGFATRGACESASASMSNAEKDFLLEAFPDLFDTTGEASSFLTKAWTCDRNDSDGLWYITDHIEEVLASDWFANRNH